MLSYVYCHMFNLFVLFSQIFSYHTGGADEATKKDYQSVYESCHINPNFLFNNRYRLCSA